MRADTDALLAQQSHAGAAAIASPSPWDALANTPFSFIRPNNVVRLDEWRRKHKRRPA
jgi:hypothetical protein